MDGPFVLIIHSIGNDMIREKAINDLLPRDMSYAMSWADDDYDTTEITIRELIPYGTAPLPIGDPVLMYNQTELMG